MTKNASNMINLVPQTSFVSNILRKIFSVTSIWMKYYEDLVLVAEEGQSEQHFALEEGDVLAPVIMTTPSPVYSVAWVAASNMRIYRKKARMPSIIYQYH